MDNNYNGGNNGNNNGNNGNSGNNNSQNGYNGNGSEQQPSSLYSYSYVNQDQQGQQNRQYYTPYDEPKHAKKKREKKHGFGVTIAKCAALALVFGLVAGGVFYGTGLVFSQIRGDNKEEVQVGANAQQEQSQGQGNDLTASNTSVTTNVVVSDVSEVVTNAMPSIVSITNIAVEQYRTWFGQTVEREYPSAGSGIIVAEDEDVLYIVTNNHVVADATELTVSFVDDTGVSAQVKGTDPSRDLAVVSVALGDIPQDTRSQIKIATLGDSTTLKVGEPAIAIGNAMGYGQSVTSGIISALDREVTVTDSNGGNAVTNDLIQTDAAINPGNSGGALLNIKGEVIGINSVKYSDTQVEGMGYAIPISTASPIINDLINKEIVDESEGGYMGINGVDVTSDLSETYGIPEGASVQRIEDGSPAAQAGLLKGDIIMSIDGYEIASWSELQNRMQYYRAGDTVELVVMRADNGEYKEVTISVTLGEKPR